MDNNPCLFCDFKGLSPDMLIADNELAYVRWDKNPVSKGHSLVIPKKHIVSFFDLDENYLLAMHSLAKIAQKIINEKYQPDAYTIGINDGEAAGRTIHHVHIHLMPRYLGDVEEPRGGIRNVFPGKGNY